jgi:hypothetical protein
MKNYSPELKIKALNLADETRSIRKEELQMKAAGRSDKRQDLYLHRIQIVRPAGRTAHIAYSMTRGRSYAQIEQKAHTAPDFKAIAKLITKYGSEQDQAYLPTWLEEADRHRTK